MKSLLIAIALIFVTDASFAACADTVSEGKRNGVYRHFMKLTGNRTWMTLKRVSDGKSFSGGIQGDYFKVLSYSVKVCKTGANGISAEKTFFGRHIKGYVTKKRGGKYAITGLGSSYDGTYVID